MFQLVSQTRTLRTEGEMAVLAFNTMGQCDESDAFDAEQRRMADEPIDGLLVLISTGHVNLASHCARHVFFFGLSFRCPFHNIRSIFGIRGVVTVAIFWK